MTPTSLDCVPEKFRNSQMDLITIDWDLSGWFPVLLTWNKWLGQYEETLPNAPEETRQEAVVRAIRWALEVKAIVVFKPLP